MNAALLHMLRSSEFWAAVIGLLGQAAVALNLLDASHFDALKPLILSYISFRLAGKTAKSFIKDPGIIKEN